MLVDQRVSPKVWPYLCPKWAMMAMNIGWDKSMAETWPSWSTVSRVNWVHPTCPSLPSPWSFQVSRPVPTVESWRTTSSFMTMRTKKALPPKQTRTGRRRRRRLLQQQPSIKKKHHPHHHNSNPRDKFQSRHHEKIRRPRGTRMALPLVRAPSGNITTGPFQPCSVGTITTGLPWPNVSGLHAQPEGSPAGFALAKWVDNVDTQNCISMGKSWSTMRSWGSLCSNPKNVTRTKQL